MAIERDAKVRLDVEATGEPEAFQEVAGDLADVQEAVDGINVEGATGGLAELGDQAGELAGQAGELSGQADTLGDSLAGLGEGAGAAGDAAAGMGDDFYHAAEKITAGLEVGKLAIKWTQQVTDGLNGLMKALGGTGKEFERMGPAIVPIASFETWATALTDVNLLLDEHTGELEEARKKHEEVRAEFLKHREALNQQADAQQNLNDKTKAFLEGLDLSKTKLREQADELAAIVENTFKLDPDLDPQALANKVEPQITALVQKLQAAGVPIGAALQGIIDKLGLVVPAAESMASGVEGAVGKLASAIDDPKIDAAIQAIIDKFNLIPAAALAASQQTAQNLNMTAEELKRLDQIMVDSARQRAEEIKGIEDAAAAAAAQREQQRIAAEEDAQKKRIESAKANQELLDAAWRDAAQRTLTSLQEMQRILGSKPDTSGLDGVREALEAIPPAASAAVDGIAQVVGLHPNDAIIKDNGPGSGPNRYAPAGGFLTPEGGPLGIG